MQRQFVKSLRLMPKFMMVMQKKKMPQNHNEVPLHASQDGCYPKVYKQ